MRRLAIAVACLALAGCGGGESSTGGTAVPAKGVFPARPAKLVVRLPGRTERCFAAYGYKTLSGTRPQSFQDYENSGADLVPGLGIDNARLGWLVVDMGGNELQVGFERTPGDAERSSSQEDLLVGDRVASLGYWDNIFYSLDRDPTPNETNSFTHCLGHEPWPPAAE